MDEEEKPRIGTRLPVFEIGQSLELLSVAEIDAVIADLRAEIARLEMARAQKRAANEAADAFFKR